MEERRSSARGGKLLMEQKIYGLSKQRERPNFSQPSKQANEALLSVVCLLQPGTRGVVILLHVSTSWHAQAGPFSVEDQRRTART